MLATAELPALQPNPIPGLAYSPDWHREQEAQEQAWLNAYARWALRYDAIPVRDTEGTPR